MQHSICFHQDIVCCSQQLVRMQGPFSLHVAFEFENIIAEIVLFSNGERDGELH
jgi:hypothetical protein